MISSKYNEINPLVSVCCLFYNHQPFIENCLEGFLLQKTNFTYEILIHDDCSTDGTIDIIKKYQNKHPRIIKPVIQEKNQYSRGLRGINAKFNFPRAQGKYIALCEGDDYWTDPYKLQKQVDFLESNPEYSLCYHKMKILTKEGDILEDFITNPPSVSSNLKDFVEKGNYIHTPSVVFRNSFESFPMEIAHVPFGDYFLYFLLGQNGRFYCIDEAMAIYRYGVGVISKMSPKEILLANMKLYTAMISCSPNDEIKEILLKRQENIFEFYFNKACKTQPLKSQIKNKFIRLFKK